MAMVKKKVISEHWSTAKFHAGKAAAWQDKADGLRRHMARNAKYDVPKFRDMAAEAEKQAAKHSALADEYEALAKKEDAERGQ